MDAIAAVFNHDPLLSVDSEDGLGTVRPASLTFESDFLLGQELEFSDPDNDSKIIGLEKFSGELLYEFPRLTLVGTCSCHPNPNLCHCLNENCASSLGTNQSHAKKIIKYLFFLLQRPNLIQILETSSYYRVPTVTENLEILRNCKIA